MHHAPHHTLTRTACTASLLLGLATSGISAATAATITIQSRDPAGVGFNDPTPVAPVGGNTGTTLGEQRMKVYRYVADLWQQALQSDVTITVNAGWEALSCTSTSAVLGSAGAWNIWYGVPGGQPGTWYPQALANKLAGVDLAAGQPDDGSGYGNVDIKTQFNINLGNTGCLDGTPFYLGLDGKAGSQVNFVETLLHELGHGLGFAVLTVSNATGRRLDPNTGTFTDTGLPSIWEGFMYDNTVGKSWLTMTSAERKASAINPLKLAWTGPNVASGASMLSPTPVARVAASLTGYTGSYDVGTASFGPAVTEGIASGPLVLPSSNKLGCDAFGTADAATISGKLVLIDRGTCAFAVKAKNAQLAGAIGVLIANNAAGAAPALGGTDATVTIPTVSVSQADGLRLKTAIAGGSRARPATATVALGVDTSRRAGADALGRPLLYTPNPLVSGSSVSHWDVSATPNLLMEPNINADLGLVLVPPKDLTLPLLKDLGW